MKQRVSYKETKWNYLSQEESTCEYEKYIGTQCLIVKVKTKDHIYVFEFKLDGTVFAA